jgi:hypothetical protein
MKKLIFTIVAIGALGLSSVFAIPQVKMATYVAGANGNFNAQPNAELAYVLDNYVLGTSKSASGYFGTFCLERVEYFNPGQIYDAVLNDRAMNGGTDNTENPDLIGDPISKGTAFLYQKFATGGLAGAYVYDSSWAAALQNMIWYLEDESAAGSGTQWNYFVALLNTEAFGYAGAKADNTPGDYGVRAMNLTQTDPTTGAVIRKQDQLVYLGVPDGGLTLSLLGLSLVGLAAFRRRFS